MRDVGVGRSGGLTNWYLMNVADMWACVQDHQTEQHWRHVAGWRKVCDLAGQHLTRLKAYRDGLARAWPPETNAAAKAYVAELDDLIDQVQRTHDAASANQTALSAATQAITSTRTELSKVYEEYARKLQQKRTWETIAADPKAAAGSRASEPPVTDAELERLNVRARGIMYGLSSELQQAQAMLRQPPPPPSAGRGINQNEPNVYGATVGPIPILPPIVPIPTPRARTIPGGQPPGERVAVPKAPGTGPVLGGNRPISESPPTASGKAASSTPSPPTSSGIHPEPSTGLGYQPRRPGTGQPSPGSIGRPTPGPHSPTAPRPAANNGLIGGIPGMINGPSSGSAAQPRRVNPVGGVIGGGAAGTAPTGAAGSRPRGVRGISSANSSLASMPAAGWPNSGGMMSSRGSGSQDGETRRWDPDQPWQVDPGVPPVVKPNNDDEPIDPGPAIGLK
ncbi:hypothetical protein GCM10009541_27540 [Micromonospora gifhornensis]|uniref:PPE family protein n=1 Tax=Micromonospora gifhornensis TaxID=84594 RepID=A0ABQ4I873_9ACTN|nr:hypothetical protein Vgi01_06700 [Micromonospora gifhornensis]